jgi:DNA-binding MarR family transcriptional regulator
MSMYDYKFAGASLTAWAQLRHTWIAVNKVAEIRLGEIGATPESIAVLWACRDFPGPLRPAEIARLVFRAPHTVAGLLKRMEKEGLVVRIPKKQGHPYTEVKLTRKGKKACAPAIEVLKDVIAETMSVMSEEELEQLGKLTRPLQLKALEMLDMKLQKSPGNPEAVTMPVKVHKRNQNK